MKKRDIKWRICSIICMAGIFISGCSQESIVKPKVIVLGTLEENSDLNMMVSQYNNVHTDCRIEIKVYGSGMYGDTEGLNDIRVEIVSGRGPDIINFGSNYSSSFIMGGITENLLPYLERSGLLKRGEYFQNIFSMPLQNEAVGAVSPSFSLLTFVGKKSLLGDKINWNIEEMETCYEQLPSGTMLFPGDNKISVFAFLCLETLDSFVDWNQATCDFMCDRFINMITFTDRFSGELMLDENFSYRDSYKQNHALLFPMTVDNIYAVGLADELLNEEAVFVGYPINRAAGKQSGNLIKPGELVLGMNVNSVCKEEAWEFMKLFFEDEYQNSINNGLPVKMSVFNKRLQEAQIPETIVDKDGNVEEVMRARINLEAENPIQIASITEEQSVRLVDIIEHADSFAITDREMYYIAREEFQMYLNGDRSARDTAEVIQRRLNMYVGEKR